jgi:hypothetical protein
MLEQLAEERIIRNLIEALERLHEDLDRVELWTAALTCFQGPPPEYRLDDQHLLPGIRDSLSRGAGQS